MSSKHFEVFRGHLLSYCNIFSWHVCILLFVNNGAQGGGRLAPGKEFAFSSLHLQENTTFSRKHTFSRKVLALKSLNFIQKDDFFKKIKN